MTRREGAFGLFILAVVVVAVLLAVAPQVFRTLLPAPSAAPSASAP